MLRNYQRNFVYRFNKQYFINEIFEFQGYEKYKDYFQA